MTDDRTTGTTRSRTAAEWPGRALKGTEEWLTGRVSHSNDRGIRLQGSSAWWNYGALKPGPLRPEMIAAGDEVEAVVAGGRWLNAVRVLGHGPAPEAAPHEDEGVWGSLGAEAAARQGGGR